MTTQRKIAVGSIVAALIVLQVAGRIWLFNRPTTVQAAGQSLTEGIGHDYSGLFPTGVDDSKNKLPAGVPDPHWLIIGLGNDGANTCQRFQSGSSLSDVIGASSGSETRFDSKQISATTVIESGTTAGQYSHNSSIVGNELWSIPSSGPIWGNNKPTARWISGNVYGQHFSNDPTTNAIACRDGSPTSGGIPPFDTFRLKLKNDFIIGDKVNLNSVKLSLNAYVDNRITVYVNGQPLTLTSGSKTGTTIEPGFSASTPATEGSAEGVFRQGPNSLEIRIDSTYSHWGLLIPEIKLTGEWWPAYQLVPKVTVNTETVLGQTATFSYTVAKNQAQGSKSNQTNWGVRAILVKAGVSLPADFSSMRDDNQAGCGSYTRLSGITCTELSSNLPSGNNSMSNPTVFSADINDVASQVISTAGGMVGDRICRVLSVDSRDQESSGAPITYRNRDSTVVCTKIVAPPNGAAYQLTPSVKAISKTIVLGQSVHFNYVVTNGAAFNSKPTNWGVRAILVKAGVSLPADFSSMRDDNQAGCGSYTRLSGITCTELYNNSPPLQAAIGKPVIFPAGETQTAYEDVSTTGRTVGDRICRVLSVDPRDQELGYSPTNPVYHNRDSVVVCVTVVDGIQPFFEMIGGDIVAYGGVMGWNANGVAGGYAGAATNLAIIATDRISGVVTNRGDPLGPNALAFATGGTNGDYGGGFKSLPGSIDYVSQLGTIRKTPISGEIDLSSLDDGVYEALSDVTLKGAVIPAGKHITIVARQAVYVAGNLTYASDPSKPFSPASLKIYATGNIIIGGMVTEAHGTFVTNDGNFYSCGEAYVGFEYEGNPIRSNCNQKLTLYGSVSAKKLILGRVIGSWNKPSPNNNAAETFVYGPEVWLGDAAAFSVGNGNSTTDGRFDNYISLPPVL